MAIEVTLALLETVYSSDSTTHGQEQCQGQGQGQGSGSAEACSGADVWRGKVGWGTGSKGGKDRGRKRGGGRERGGWGVREGESTTSRTRGVSPWFRVYGFRFWGFG